ncbi:MULTISPECIES: geranylgeranyl reductase [Prochlorococcus]|uniref:Geranylgeranyl reductase n=1 Tax=Prochlorococcus marinus (strain SARG / CCMP1375 / SS120) TaxID=167539 RepID=Q7VCA9_PROMA|nr:MULTISPECIES: geranylgeranyl reductase [Prochlorococcus]AAP99876.1 Geranylgeranyl hydrogenase ChlP [Prochlorococcus marinus subsp. marinus str. CCMP1375]KGG11777.1 Geranylgeranyl hydrogenase BchP [Prochlorococcus marinus str. LG]KGG18809.1 Geranylgeranyl hydrogenase BchP [Prochlorococcus marinus str. SS2]KGG23653.1 Geranylgeranyl hydrogenase BchP [Prochlorococcus marinus str. SS35]KGG32111.1 Geranylgeranyl hydrogenase BchP [Prochlorococcus marinus str. SS51]
MLRVAVIGGGPSGSCTAEILAKAGIKTWIFERKLDNAKPCGGAIPLCMVSEFELPDSIIDRKVRNMRMISPSNREVDISLDKVYGETENEYIGMCRREVMDAFMRNRAAELGAILVNGLVTKIETGTNRQGPYTLNYSDYSSGDAKGEAKTLEVDLIVGADGANSRVAKAMDAGDYNVAIAFQERIKLPEKEMSYYEDLAEMYVGTDVSPDFYGWVFPKFDHVAVGTGTMQKNQALIKDLQEGVRERAQKRLVNGEVIKVEAHPIPEHPRPRRVVGRMALVGDAAGYVTKSSGEGIYFAAKSGRMCAEEIVSASQGGSKIPTEDDLKKYIKKWDKKYGATYKVLEILQNIFYSNDGAREAFVEMCDDIDVQRLTFDSYLYKTVVAMKPLQQLKLTFMTLGSVLRGRALAPKSYKPVPSTVRGDEEVNKMLAVSTIKGGIKVGKKKVK